MRSVTRSRVVPGVAVTMARSRSTSAIEERAFAGVGPADDGQGQPVVDDAAAGEGGFEGGERRRQLVDAAGDLGLRRHVHIVFGKVDAGFEQGNQLHQRLLDGRTRRLSAPPIWLAA